MTRHRYSKAEREEAALICAIAASGGTREHYGQSFVYGNIFTQVGESEAALRLAVHAWNHLAYSRPWTRELDAEAEALIRTGWTP